MCKVSVTELLSGVEPAPPNAAVLYSKLDECVAPEEPLESSRGLPLAVHVPTHAHVFLVMLAFAHLALRPVWLSRIVQYMPCFLYAMRLIACFVFACFSIRYEAWAGLSQQANNLNGSRESNGTTVGWNEASV